VNAKGSCLIVPPLGPLACHLHPHSLHPCSTQFFIQSSKSLPIGGWASTYPQCSPLTYSETFLLKFPLLLHNLSLSLSLSLSHIIPIGLQALHLKNQQIFPSLDLALTIAFFCSLYNTIFPKSFLPLPSSVHPRDGSVPPYASDTLEVPDGPCVAKPKVKCQSSLARALGPTRHK
jgi:hypothetical protein